MPKPKRTLWMIRHGLRLDVHDPNWLKTTDRPHDTPLSPDGFVQAGEVGERLASESIDHLFASPFLRAMQTAHHIAQRLRPAPRIRVEHGLCEAFFEKWFPVHPTFPTTHQFTRDFPLVDHSYESAVHPSYPEDPALLQTRTARAIRAIIEQTQGNVAVVTHGGAITALASALLPQTPSLHAACCCLVQLEKSAGQWRLLRDGRDTSHLSRTEQSIRFA